MKIRIITNVDKLCGAVWPDYIEGRPMIGDRFKSNKGIGTATSLTFMMQRTDDRIETICEVYVDNIAMRSNNGTY